MLELLSRREAYPVAPVMVLSFSVFLTFFAVYYLSVYLILHLSHFLFFFKALRPDGAPGIRTQVGDFAPHWRFRARPNFLLIPVKIGSGGRTRKRAQRRAMRRANARRLACVGRDRFLRASSACGEADHRTNIMLPTLVYAILLLRGPLCFSAGQTFFRGSQQRTELTDALRRYRDNFAQLSNITATR